MKCPYPFCNLTLVNLQRKSKCQCRHSNYRRSHVQFLLPIKSPIPHAFLSTFDVRSKTGNKEDYQLSRRLTNSSSYFIETKMLQGELKRYQRCLHKISYVNVSLKLEVIDGVG